MSSSVSSDNIENKNRGEERPSIFSLYSQLKSVYSYLTYNDRLTLKKSIKRKKKNKQHHAGLYLNQLIGQTVQWWIGIFFFIWKKNIFFLNESNSHKHHFMCMFLPHSHQPFLWGTSWNVSVPTPPTSWPSVYPAGSRPLSHRQCVSKVISWFRIVQTQLRTMN